MRLKCSVSLLFGKSCLILLLMCIAWSGAKLCMILDLLGSSGSVTGIDVARHRLAACRTMVLKYSLGDRCRLFVADGTLFSLLPIRVFSGSNSGIHIYRCLILDFLMFNV